MITQLLIKRTCQIFVTFMLLILFVGTLHADDWLPDLNAMLSSFLSCQSPIDDKSPCNVFLARALERVYNIHDFDAVGQDPPYMTANQIANYVELSGNWTCLGSATNQASLNSAEDYANRGKAVIAVAYGNPHGHVALILPGTVSRSSTWNLNVPNSASFFLNRPADSYIGKPLSFAYSQTNSLTVRLYGRNF